MSRGAVNCWLICGPSLKRILIFAWSIFPFLLKRLNDNFRLIILRASHFISSYNCSLVIYICIAYVCDLFNFDRYMFLLVSDIHSVSLDGLNFPNTSVFKGSKLHISLFDSEDVSVIGHWFCCRCDNVFRHEALFLLVNSTLLLAWVVAHIMFLCCWWVRHQRLVKASASA